MDRHSKTFQCFCVTFLGLIHAVILSSSDLPSYLIVQTTTGPVRGLVVPTFTNKEARVFYGIPYAQPPIGNLRFKPPLPVTPWTEVFDATREAHPCYQTYTKELLKISQLLGKTVRRPWKENCLTLSVWTPIKVPDDAPAVIYIHDGDYMTGTGVYPYFDLSTFALETELVLATFNYRLGAFGFLSFGTQEFPGNLGLMDQHEMIKWFKGNIKNFGGKEDALFLMGFGSGAEAVIHHIILETNSGLFRTGVLSGGSPSCLKGLQTNEEAMQLARALASSLGCQDLNLTTVEKCLQNAHPEDIVDASLSDTLISSLGFKPIIDGEFVKENPAEAMKAGRFNKNNVILMLGDQESSLTFLSLNEDILSSEDSGLNEEDFMDAVNRSGLAQTEAEVRVIREWYLGRNTSRNKTQILDLAVQVYSDGLVRCCAEEFLKYAHDGGVLAYKVVAAFGDPRFPSWIGAHSLSFFPLLSGFYLNPKHNFSLEVKAASMSGIYLAKVYSRKKAIEFQEVVPLYNPERRPYLFYNNAVNHRENYREDACVLWNEIIPAMRKSNPSCKWK